VSIKVLTAVPDPVAPTAPSNWALMEARLATTKVHDLLDEAASRLTRLAGEVDLPPEVVEAVRETLQHVETGRGTIATARRQVPQR
jgi:hypothetical protein